MTDGERPVLLCLDLEPGSEGLALRGAGYAERLGRPLHLLYVLPESSVETEESAVNRLEAVAAAVGTAGVVAVRRGRVEERIVEYIKENGVEMVILGHRHRARRERVYVGSTTKTVISLAPGPVLVVPIDGERE
ncbi:MAG: hypothetical protein BMS9Abin23_0010 [Thermodesulfobacteriota bacterium]|nr:MAG: hypothetical protein BMS9Abin23_0010 [Thermodesulfobacteriota bacterium]